MNNKRTDQAIRDAAHGILVGCNEKDVYEEMTQRRKFSSSDAYLITVAARLFAKDIEQAPNPD